MLFYLKINRNEKYTIRNLQHWIDAISLYKESHVYVVCDKEDLENDIRAKLITYGMNIEYVKSDYQNKDEFENLAKAIAQDYWFNAAKAHLFTFFHAKELGEDYFWNIDADDTFFCVEKTHVYQIMQNVEKCIYEKETTIASLDMHHSRSQGKHWSFGVTFVDNRLDWVNYISKYVYNEKYLKLGSILEKYLRKNVDWMFTLMNEAYNDIKAVSFYVENIKFIHYSNDFFKRPISSGMYYWHDGILEFPILNYCIGLKSMSVIPIAIDTKKIEIDVSKEEICNFMLEHSFEKEFCDFKEKFLDLELADELTRVYE